MKTHTATETFHTPTGIVTITVTAASAGYENIGADCWPNLYVYVLGEANGNVDIEIETD